MAALSIRRLISSQNLSSLFISFANSMKKLDWYILKKILVTFFFCMILFTLIAIAIDSSEHTENFVKSGLSTREIISQYYVGFIPYIWGLLFPLFVFIAVIYTTSRMAMRSEIIAILAGGTSFIRFLRPYFFGRPDPGFASLYRQPRFYPQRQ